jgi:hypothetical protein
MKYMICVIDTVSGTGNSQEMAAIDEFNDSLKASGQLLMAEGIQSPEESIVIDNRSNAGVITQGPLHQTTEYVSGFWVITASSDSEAEALAVNASKACNRKVELRPLFG